jgi:hypothetical protein
MQRCDRSIARGGGNGFNGDRHGHSIPLVFWPQYRALIVRYAMLLFLRVAIATGQLWNAFHNCPYGMGIVMERIVFMVRVSA